VGAEPAVSAPLGGDLAALAPVLEALPSPLLLIAPGTADVFHANAAAHRLAGGAFPMGRLDLAVAPEVARGEPVANVQVAWRERSLVVSGGPIALPGGERVTVLTLEDVTELESARRRAGLLADAGARLAGSLDLPNTLAAVGAVVVPEHADWCFVELVRDGGGLERALIEHFDPDRLEYAIEYDRRYPLDPDAPVGSARVIRTGEPELITDMPDEFLERAAGDPEQLRLLRGVGFRSSLIVPLRVRGAIIGDLALAYADSGRRFGPDDVPVVQALADRCATAIDVARLYDEARRSRDELHAVLEGIADAVTVQAPDRRVIYANAAAARMYGLPDGDAMRSVTQSDYATRFELTDEEGGPFDPARLPGRAALAGGSPPPVTLRFRDRESGETRWARIKSTPVRDEGGAVRLAINVIEDITELKRSEEGQRFLAEASRTLASSLDYERTLATVAELAVTGIADWCVVDLAEEDGKHRVALAHPDPDTRAFVDELQRRYPPREDRSSAVAGVLRTGRSLLLEEITDEMLREGAHDEEHLRLMRSVGLRSAMVVPMTALGRVLGVISFVSRARSFDAHDLALAEDLGLRAGVAVDNARLYRTASRIASTLQTSLLPPHLPDVPGAELAALYRPAGAGLEVGGDFYDVFSVADDQWYLVVGDVCGKGAEAAAITALVRHTVRSAAVRLRSPAAILRWVAEAMVRHEGGDGRFCTVACAHVDFSGGGARLTVSCGGHPLPALLRADGTVEEVGAPGTLLGLVADPHVEDRATELAPGDALVLYTDGLTEARAPAEVWSPDDLARVLARAAGKDAAGIVEHLSQAAIGAAEAPRDDVAILALRRT
jgi:serine phosphatase RsbU (regulator of sigma subunit)/PAS domain-containing protein